MNKIKLASCDEENTHDNATYPFPIDHPLKWSGFSSSSMAYTLRVSRYVIKKSRDVLKNYD